MFIAVSSRERHKHGDPRVYAHVPRRTVAKPRDRGEQSCCWRAWGWGRALQPPIFPGEELLPSPARLWLGTEPWVDR